MKRLNFLAAVCILFLGCYLDLAFADFKGSTIEIDFNKAYNPYCAFSDGYNCPIPPQENNLSIAIRAGEQQYNGAHKQRKNKE